MRALIRTAVPLALAAVLGATGWELLVDRESNRRAPPPEANRRQPAAPSDELAQALEAIRRRGFAVDETSTWVPEHRLHVLVGAPLERGATAPPEQVFFFIGDRFAATDGRASGSARVLWTDGDTVAVSYQLWKPRDANCCPTAGAVTVRFQLRRGRVVALDPVPPSSRAFDPN